ncbi:MAG: RNA methyltransferase [Gammaproteobacteria bacterium]|nr:RNA methyltransferase [Gammaproteobacteria bacterium]MCY4281627.1 RNA methyltransferase [Gammaproteobacteria bacterium]MCY4339497.1 RNA methyltransferase [Gammaproteobacteria bacterium]
MTPMIKIVLVDTTHPGNIGAGARAMKTMGLERLTLVSPQRFPSAECTARAAGADDLLARAEVFSSLEDAVADCALVFGASARTRSIAWPEVTPETAATQILDQVGNGGGAAILFGRESSGLSNEQLEVCHAMIRIPTNADFASLNIAAAVQIICYEINKQRLARAAAAEDGLTGVSAGAGPRPAAPDTDVNASPGDDGTVAPVTTKDMEYLYEHLEQTLDRVGYLDRKKPRHLMRRLRRLFNRARLDSNEYNILRGILTAIGNSRG